MLDGISSSYYRGSMQFAALIEAKRLVESEARRLIDSDKWDEWLLEDEDE